MDQRANLVEQDIKDIAETRLEISRKVRLIEDNMKTKWFGLSEMVAEKGNAFIYQSARTLNPARQMNERPWKSLAGVVLFGVVIGMLEKKFPRAKAYHYLSEGLQESQKGPSSLSSDLWGDVKSGVRAEVERSTDAVSYAVREFTRDMAKKVVPTILRSMGPTLSRGFRR